MQANIEEEYKAKLIKAIEAIKNLKQELEQEKSKQLNREAIAVVGIGCRYPGGIHDLDSFWDLLENKRDASGEMPNTRWDVEKLYDPNRDQLGKMYTKRGSFIDDLDLFDNQYFNISNREALIMDPQQRLLLEVTYEALDHAGLCLTDLNESNTSVYIGCTSDGYEQRHIKSFDTSKIDPYSITGYFRTALAGRISYLLGLRGPNVAVDTGCSASLVAIHLACQSLNLRESDIAIAGGVNTLLSPEHFIALSTMNALSVDGRCHTFDAAADGFGRGDGCGVLVLKRLSDAERDKDRIWAVIKGTAINQDGKSNGFTAPNMSAQVDVIQTALKQAGMHPDDIDLVESHGTGTPIGDPIEIEGLQNAYSKKKKNSPLYVGALKSNFGHTEGAAGVAGVIKSILAFQHKKIPANLHFNAPSPYIDWEGANITIPTELTDWVTDGRPRAAGVNSFGISGTNSHVIVQEYTGKQELKGSETKGNQIFYLPVSARTPKALSEYALRMSSFLSQSGDDALVEICRNAVYRKTHYEYRALAVGRDRLQLIEQLNAIANQYAEGTGAPALSADECKTVFVFPGQGAQWIGMAQGMFASDEGFRSVLSLCDEKIKARWGWSVLEELFKDAEHSSFSQIEIIQPLLCVIEIAIAETWIKRRLRPDAVIGHSMGEVAAAYISGILDLEDALNVICTRSQLMKQKSGLGAMALVELSASDIKPYLEAYSRKVSVAVVNSPNSTVISGDKEIVNELVASFESKDIFAKLINVEVASHSPQMDDLKEDLLDQLRGVRAHKTKIPFYSTVKAEKISGEDCSNRYWVDNLRNPVQFARMVELLLEDGFNIFVEITPHPVLTHALEQIINHKKASAFAFSSLLRNKTEDLQFASSWGNLYSAGYPVDWTLIYEGKPSCLVLPSYPWQHKSFWLPLPNSVPQTDMLPQAAHTAVEADAEQSILQVLKGCEDLLERSSLLEGFLKNTAARVLKITPDEINVQTEFKKMGVDSLMLMQIRVPIEKQLHLKIGIKTFVEQNSIQKLTSFLLSQLDFSQVSDDSTELSMPTMVKDRGFMMAEVMLDDAIQIAASLPIPKTGGALITGATGFIGAFLVAEMLENSDDEIYCLVRAKDNKHAMERLVNAMESYGCYPKNKAARLHALAGDITLHQFGLQDKDYQDLSGRVNRIFHLAAWVKWLFTYEDAKSENVGSLTEVLKFAIHGHLKHLHYTSTIGTYGSLLPELRERKIHEDELLDRPESLVGSYSQTKWVVDQILDVAAKRGLVISRYRIGDIKGHSRTGKGNLSDFVNSYLKVCIELRAMPDVDMDFNLIPVDFLCRAMRILSEKNVDQARNYQFNNNHILCDKELIAELAKMDIHLQVVPRKEWLDRIMDNPVTRVDACYQDVAVVLKPLFKDMQTGTDICYIDLLSALSKINFSDEQARTDLQNENVQFPDTYRDRLLECYVDHFLAIGYVNNEVLSSK